jgi:hypothetical protein
MSIVGQPGYLVENVIVSNISLQFAGGGTIADAKRQMPDRPEAYPEYNNYGVTPAYGINLKHIKNIQLNTIRLSYARDDARPALFMEDVEEADISLFRAKIGKEATALIRSKDIRGLYLHDPKPSALTGALYITFEGVAKDITIMSDGLQKIDTIYNSKDVAGNKEIRVINSGVKAEK